MHKHHAHDSLIAKLDNITLKVEELEIGVSSFLDRILHVEPSSTPHLDSILEPRKWSAFEHSEALALNAFIDQFESVLLAEIKGRNDWRHERGWNNIEPEQVFYPEYTRSNVIEYYLNEKPTCLSCGRVGGGCFTSRDVWGY